MAEAESKAARRVIAGLSVLVVVLVAVVLYAVPHGKENGSTGGGPDGLATVNACLNGASAVLLLLGYSLIRRKNVALHRLAMSGAFTLSSAFLVTYLIHHARVGSVPYRGTGALRALYFAILVPHVVLAAVIVPMALLTIYRGFIRDIARHRPLARRTLPLWLYVSVSGVVLYFMLYGTSPR
jgi:putative membrane protein